MESRRKCLRIKDYDYSSPGAYFVTICTKNRICLFGRIYSVEDSFKPSSTTTPHMEINEYGEIVSTVWQDLVNHNKGIKLGPFIVMPNHIHGIIHIFPVGVGSEPTPTVIGLPEIVRQLKTYSAMRINIQKNISRVPVWQRGYFEHIIRDEEDYNRIARYILENPLNWIKDEENQ